jgi:hypothetical protein
MSLTFRVLSDKKAIMNARLITPVAGILPHRLVSQQRLCLPQL